MAAPSTSACDLAEVLGAAIALNLLFHVPLLAGVVLTAADTILLLWFQRFGIRTIEAVILSLIAVIALSLCIEVFWAKPSFSGMLAGLVPRLNGESLYVAIGLMGATVMPHNLYLHSALVQTRSFDPSPAGKRQALKFNLVDSLCALNGAFVVNAAILILAGAKFFGQEDVTLQKAHELLPHAL